MKYEVKLARSLLQETVVEIDADSDADAMAIATDLDLNERGGVTWRDVSEDQWVSAVTELT